MRQSRQTAVVTIVIGLYWLLWATQVSAADGAEDAVKFRQGIMNAMAWNAGPIAYMVKGDMPFDDARFTVLAARIAVLATMALEGFTPNTALAKSRVRAELWQHQDDFKKRMQDLETGSAALAKAAERGDEAQMRLLFGDTLKICKACHDEYQVKR